MSSNPFHAGELRVQQRVGETDEAVRNSPMIASHIPSGANAFLHQQSMLVVAVLDHEAVWCLPMAGKPGWLAATRQALHLDLTQLLSPPDERIRNAAQAGHRVGTVALDFAIRRRLRINGTLAQPSATLITLSAAEAYPNCPKYITERDVVWSAAPTPGVLSEGQALTAPQRNQLQQTDVFFLATQHPERGLDASHRGGNPGFLSSTSDTTVRFDDYPGNSLYNTLGNLEIDPRIGILFPNFTGGNALAITGTASVAYADLGRSRSITVTIARWTEVPLTATASASELSPYNP